MALRIAGKKQIAPAPDPEELTEAPSQDNPMEEQAEMPDMQEEDLSDAQEPDTDVDDQSEGDGSLSPFTAGYMGPEEGPFMCKNCVYFAQKAPNTCHIVAGPIDPEGCCNLYTPAGEATDTEHMGAPATDVTPIEPQEPGDETMDEGA